MKEIINYIAGEYDLIVVGAGHAGTEAALAGARMGQKTVMLTMNLDSIVALSCNPNIGGTGKGHLVREVDALGGEMALNIDRTFIQSRMLNTSKGPAVHSLRVQADKRSYHDEMKKVLENTENLHLRQAEVVDILVEDNVVKGVTTSTGAQYLAKSVVLCTGTYLKGKIYIGEFNYESGPDGMKGANELSESLKRMGIELMRLKTGTPARVHRDSIDFSKMEIQEGDSRIIPFSFRNIQKNVQREQVPCYLTYTTEKCHEIIRKNIHRSAMYLGDIEGAGARYCPSIEDKVVRFADRDQHQVFIEPEGLTTKEMYVQGVSSSLPEEVQIELYKNIVGLEKVEFMRTAYAIEYDAINATELKQNLEHRQIHNLFFAGQINGSSGYEEAAAQGIMAGINAARNNMGEEAFILDRSEAYIGVLIDDLVIKGTKEPYRMMTSRAEYRLTLRQDNADLRLTEKAYNLGLIDKTWYEEFCSKRESIEKEVKRLESVKVNPTEETNKILVNMGTTPIKTGLTLAEIIRRPEISYKETIDLDNNRVDLREDIAEEVEIQIKYEGYIKKQSIQIEQFKKLENKKLADTMDYSLINGLRNEAKEKLNKIKPESIGQASRITGVSPADINILLIHLEQVKRGIKNEE